MKIIVRNMAVEYRDEGTGPAFLMLHGWQDSMATFDALTPLLAADHRVVTLDLPGFGASEMPPTAWSLGDYTRFVREFIDKLGLQVAVLIGHSMGGRIIIKGIAEKVLDADKIVLMASAGVARRSASRNAFWYALAKIGRFVTAIPPLTFLRDRMRRRLYRFLGSDYDSAGALKDTLVNIVNEDLTDAARRIQVPALLIWGSEDAATPLRDGQRLATFIPGATLKVLSGAGHFVHQEKPRDVSGLIRKFAS